MAGDAHDAPARTARPGGAPFVDRLPRSVIDRYLQEHPEEPAGGSGDPAEHFTTEISQEGAGRAATGGLRALALLPGGECLLADNCDFRPRPAVVVVDAAGRIVTPVPVVRAVGDFPLGVALDEAESVAHLSTLGVGHPGLLAEVLEMLRNAP